MVLMNQSPHQSLRYSEPEQKLNCAVVHKDFKEKYELKD